MGQNSNIEWCSHTFNAWWGCHRQSPACDHCYAEAFANRLGLKIWGSDAPRRFFGDAHWHEPVKWNRAAARAGVRARVFCNSMADVFEFHRELDEPRARLWTLIEATPWLTWLLLTKRPQNILAMAPPSWLAQPRENVQYGTTAEDQRWWDVRIPILRAVPARHRFVSAEPLLGPIVCGSLDGISQLIVGGESGSGARPCDLAWIRSIVAQCKAAGTPVFVKQVGAKPVETFNDVERHDVRLRDRKGGDIEEFPADLRIREMPTVETFQTSRRR